ncbi:MAG: radical SAM protein [Elusimicrobia bacterium]|nr:radical SAM protein [Elusimicrobiota bacterium]
MRILLINPPVENTVRSEVPALVTAHVGVFPPLGLLYVAAFCNARTPHRAEVLDAVAEGLSYDGMARRIQAAAPDLVGITAHTHSLVDVMMTAALVKRCRPQAHVCMGGAHPSHFPRAAARLPGVDSVIPGDGEAAFAELAGALAGGGDLRSIKGLLFKQDGGIVETGAREPERDLDLLPQPDRSLLSAGRYRYILSRDPAFTTMISSRGCPFACTFCSTPKGPCRMRSPENVVAEMARCAGAGLRDIHFVDDIFNQDPERVSRICSLLSREKLRVGWSFRGRVDRVSAGLFADLRRAGCYSIHFGVECASDEGLAGLNKGIRVEQARQAFALARQAGLRTVAYFLVGCPHERTREDVLRTVAFARELRANFALFNILTPYPATALYEAGLRADIIPRDVWGEFIANPTKDFRYPFWNEHFSNEELASLLRLAYRRFYLRPGFLWDALLDCQAWKVVLRRLGAGIGLLRGGGA